MLTTTTGGGLARRRKISRTQIPPGVAGFAAGGIDHLFFTSGSDIGFYQEATAKAHALGHNNPVRLITVPLEHISLNAALGFAAVGTLFAAMAVNTRAREALLPILLLPILVPLIIATVRGTSLAMDGAGWNQLAPWINLLIVFDLLFLTLSFLTFHLVLEE